MNLTGNFKGDKDRITSNHNFNGIFRFNSFRRVPGSPLLPIVFFSFSANFISSSVIQFDFLILPGSLLISEWVLRISSASFCAVGRTSVWCSDIKYCANFCNCSRLICNKVSANNKEIRCSIGILGRTSSTLQRLIMTQNHINGSRF